MPSSEKVPTILRVWSYCSKRTTIKTTGKENTKEHLRKEQNEVGGHGWRAQVTPWKNKNKMEIRLTYFADPRNNKMCRISTAQRGYGVCWVIWLDASFPVGFENDDKASSRRFAVPRRGTTIFRL